MSLATGKNYSRWDQLPYGRGSVTHWARSAGLAVLIFLEEPKHPSYILSCFPVGRDALIAHMHAAMVGLPTCSGIRVAGLPMR
jgi:hypothetical protein